MNKSSKENLNFWTTLATLSLVSTISIGAVVNALAETRIERELKEIKKIQPNQSISTFSSSKKHSKWAGYTFGAVATTLLFASCLSSREY